MCEEQTKCKLFFTYNFPSSVVLTIAGHRVELQSWISLNLTMQLSFTLIIFKRMDKIFFQDSLFVFYRKKEVTVYGFETTGTL